MNLDRAIKLLENMPRLNKTCVGITVSISMLEILRRLPESQPSVESILTKIMLGKETLSGIPIHCKTDQKEDWLPWYSKKELDDYLNEWKVIRSWGFE